VTTIVILAALGLAGWYVACAVLSLAAACAAVHEPADAPDLRAGK